MEGRPGNVNHFFQEKMPAYASASFGTEGLVAGELRRLGLQDVRAENGGVRFTATAEELFLCNLRLRISDRVFILAAEQRCESFEELFQLVSSVPWEEALRGTEAVNLSCKCARSRLMSPRDCQSVSKKAILRRISQATGRSVFPENDSPFPVHIQIHSDVARVMVNTSGPSLSRRGYRTWNGEAPLRETLAAALVELSPWRPGQPLHDPCCGTGTLLIEAAFRAMHRAPGLNRSFAMEDYAFVNREALRALRQQTEREVLPQRTDSISGSDIDPEALELAGRHLKQAGLEGGISLSQQPLENLQLTEEGGTFLCNPPYGERLGDRESCHQLYRELRALKARHPGWHLCAISSDPAFEKAYGRRADKRHRLYNGTLECVFYVYQ